MLKAKIKKYYQGGVFLLLLVFFGVFFVAQISLAINIGLSYGDSLGLGKNDPIVMILNFIRIFLGFLAFIAVILVLWSGWLWMTAGGNEAQIEQAKKTLKNALIGIFIILASFGIVSFVVNMILDASGGKGSPGSGTKFMESSASLRALGDGIIKYVYPEPGQKDVPMNSVIVVTFREKIDPATICQNVSGGFCAPNTSLITDNIRIFKQVYSAECAGAGACPNALEAFVSSSDNETFVFSPKERLGSVSEYSMDYAVFLTKAIKKLDGSDAFRALENGYIWGFSVSNKMDLEPPWVEKYGVFPRPDNESDQSGVISEAVQATGEVKVVSQPKLHTPAELLGPVISLGGSPPVNGIVDPHSKAAGLAEIVILADGITAKISLGGVSMGSTRVDADTIAFPGLLSIELSNPADVYAPGNTWSVQISAEIPADTLTVDNRTYVFSAAADAGRIVTDPNPAVTAANIKAAINGEDGFNIPNPKVSASNSSNLVTVTARIAGVLGNNIALYDNTAALDIAQMSGGKNRVVDVIVQGGARDQPRNAVIQVDFNEPVNPITLSGSSDEVAEYIRVVNADGGAAAGAACAQNSDCRSYSCSGLICQGDRLAGKFMVSNQYKTVEFVSDNECGINSCGDKIYCLPENSHLKVELDAADLADCGPDACAAKSPYNICGALSICSDPDGHYYPLASFPLTGIVDMAINSLDGNRSGYADGPNAQSSQPPYNENAPNAGDGDDFIWSFFISDEIDIAPPVIEKISQSFLSSETDILPDTVNILPDSPVQIYFNKLMMSSTLSSGEHVIKDPFTKALTANKMINLWCLNPERAVGYWITKQDLDVSIPLDNYADKTKAYVNHSKFGMELTYRIQAGSGIKDIYQNCYSPSSRDGTAACAGGPSCCNGAPEASSACP